MRFLCDQMLGTLAKWLRLFGFDTYYANSEIDDNNILEIAKKEKRVLISRDKELIIRAKKKKVEVFEIKTTDLDRQLKLVLNNIDMDEKAILTRCSLCNSLVEEIDKKDVVDFVPEKVFKNNDKFWFCSECKKYYWMGSHYDKIKDKIKFLSKKS